MVDYPLPKDVLPIWNRFKISGFVNTGMVFDRYSPNLESDAPNSKDEKKRISDLKRNTLAKLVDFAKHADSHLLKAWNLRWETMVVNGQASPFTLQTDWRFVTGLGAKGSLEVGFNFHKYGFPYLPGSGLKGLARAFALVEVAEERGTTHLKTLNDKVLSIDNEGNFREAFADRNLLETERSISPNAWILADAFRLVFGTSGSEGQSGRAIFYDGIPSEEALPKLVVDIMNPHFPNYYRDSAKNAPTDSQNPVPVLFLAVEPNQSFRFAVGWRGTPDSTAHEKAQEWLRQGLFMLGAGAKTSAGYGYFVNTESKVKATLDNRASTSTSSTLSVPNDIVEHDLEGVLLERDTKRRRITIRTQSGEKIYAEDKEVKAPTPPSKSEVLYDLKNGKPINIRKK